MIHIEFSEVLLMYAHLVLTLYLEQSVLHIMPCHVVEFVLQTNKMWN